MIEKVTGRGEGCRPDPLFSQNRCPLAIGKDIDPSAGEPDEQQTAVVRQRTGEVSGDVGRPDDLDDVSTFIGNSFRIENEGVRLSRRGFDAGARSHWHAHGADQLLVVQEGRMRYQREGSRMQEVDLHESTYLPGGIAHWHGAVPDRALTQVSVIFGEGIEWMEPVTDAQYEGDADR